MTMRKYTQCAKELVIRKLQDYMQQEHAVLRPSSHSPKIDDLVMLDEVGDDGKTVTKYYIRIEGRRLLEIKPSSNKRTADAPQKDGSGVM
jgi:hypothetical protein